MCHLASFSNLTLSFLEHVRTHFCLARLKLDTTFTLILKHVFFDAVFAELFSQFCNLLKALDMLLHALNVSVFLQLFALALEV